jgi:hypothetical protein
MPERRSFTEIPQSLQSADKTPETIHPNILTALPRRLAQLTLGQVYTKVALELQFNATMEAGLMEELAKISEWEETPTGDYRFLSVKAERSDIIPNQPEHPIDIARDLIAWIKGKGKSRKFAFGGLQIPQSLRNRMPLGKYEEVVKLMKDTGMAKRLHISANPDTDHYYIPEEEPNESST